MTLRCDQCGEALFAEDVYLDEAVARCPGCQAVVDLSAHLASGGEVRARRSIERPRDITVRLLAAEPRHGGYRDPASTDDVALEIVRRWPWSLRAYFVSLVWMSIVVTSAALDADRRALGALIIVLPVTYVLLAMQVNRTTIRVTARAITVSHGPMPWPGGRSTPLRALRRVQLVELRGRNHRSRRIRTWAIELRAVFDGDRRARLLRLQDREHARFIQQEIEHHLGIDVVPVVRRG